MGTRLFLVAVTLISSTVLYSPSKAGDNSKSGGRRAFEPICYPYYNCMVSDYFGDRLMPGPAPNGVSADPTFYHTDCRLCQDLPCHFGCGGSDEEEQVAYRSLVDGFSTGDVKAIFALATEMREYLAWNPERSAIQLLSCDGSVTGSLVLNPSMAEGLASLPTDWGSDNPLLR